MTSPEFGKIFNKLSNEWQTVSKEEKLGVISKFENVREKGAIYIKSFPFRQENLNDKLYMDKFIDSIVSEVADRIAEKGLEPDTSPTFVLELTKYEKETGIASFTIFEVAPDEFNFTNDYSQKFNQKI